LLIKGLCPYLHLGVTGMVFKKREENGGQLDPSINANGRPLKTAKGRTKRAVRDGELLSLLRKVKPHIAEAVNTAVGIMKNAEATHMNKLKACVILLENYKQLVGDVYEGEEDDNEVQEVQPQGPLFSLHVLPTKDNKPVSEG
jgi:hypothetical protein